MNQVWIPKMENPKSGSEGNTRSGTEIRSGSGSSPGIRHPLCHILARMGLYPDSPKLPAVVGYEVAGTVDGIGEGVEDFSDGDRVVCMTRFGGYSDVSVRHRRRFGRFQTLDFEGAASIPVNYLTAWLMLVRLGNVRRGERCWCTPARVASAWPRSRSADIRSRSHRHGVGGQARRLLEMGVSACIDYRTKDFQEEVKRLTDGRGVDIVLDAVGGESFRKSYKSLADLGRLFIFGASSLAPGTKRSWISALTGLSKMGSFKPLQLMSHNRGVYGVNVGHLWHHGDELTAMLGEILNLFADGTFKPMVDRSFPFSDAAAAHRYIQERKNFGKVVLKPDIA